MPEPIDPIGVPEIFVDGVSDVRIIEGVTRIPFYARRDGEGEVVVRLAIPVAELPDVIQTLVITLANAVKTVIKPALSS